MDASMSDDVRSQHVALGHLRGDPDFIRSDEESAEETDDPSNPLAESSEDEAASEEGDGDLKFRIPNEEGLSEQERSRTVEILRDLRYTMETSQRDFVFACGGSIPITTPFTLRWDPRDEAKPASHCKLVVPEEGQSTNRKAIDALVADMLPATFGLGGEDVYDEEYRKALQLDPSKFSTNFCPYTSGIIDHVTQILAPGFGDQTSSVRAELYKLNVYQGPSGHFRSHVDTPRSLSHFGSLVVCLSVHHSGGALEVRHNDKPMRFDWSKALNPAEPAIQWAAFYSDCEHQVLPVTSGHRLTLAYNLYAITPDPDLSKPTDLDLPLLGHMETVLDNPHFLPKGGYLGFFTTHAYAHTSANFSISAHLKGIDKAIWQGFQNLGCGVCLRPVLDVCGLEEEEEEEQGGHGGSPRARPVLGKYFNLTTVEGGMKSWDREEGVKYDEVVWLNEVEEGKHKEAQFAHTVYGNEAIAQFVYSWCAIIIGVPGYNADEEHGGGRMRVAKTFEERTRDWDDPLCTVSFLPQDMRTVEEVEEERYPPSALI